MAIPNFSIINKLSDDKPITVMDKNNFFSR